MRMALKKVVFFLAQQGFRDEEFFEPWKILEPHCELHVASLKKGVCRGKLGGSVEAELGIDELMKKLAEFDMIVFIGGPGAHAFIENAEVNQLATRAMVQKKRIAAICIAPAILAHAGVLKGRKATVWDDEKKTWSKFLTTHGSTYVDEPVVADTTLLITANGPQSAKTFGMKLKEVLV